MKDVLGKILVAAPNLQDSFFDKAIVLVTHEKPHGQGFVGYTLNKPIEGLSCLATFENLVGSSFPQEWRPLPFFSGGPLQSQGIVFLHSPDYATTLTREINSELLQTLARHDDIIHAVTRKTPQQVLPLIGFCAWTKEAMEIEVALGAWGVLPFDSKIVFAEDRTALWPYCAERVRCNRPDRSFGADKLLLSEPPTKTLS